MLESFLDGSYMPHGHCLLWLPDLLITHVGSDAFIALAYFSIPLALGYFVHKRKDLPLNYVFWMFIAFITLCGLTHIMNIWNVWHGHYYIAGAIKAACALVSIYTAFMLWALLPKALTLPSAQDLIIANAELNQAVVRRKATEDELKRFNEQLEDTIKSRTQDLLHEVAKVKQRDEALRLGELKLRTLVSATSSVIIELSPSGDMLESGEQWSNFTGQSSQEATGRSWMSAIHPDERPQLDQALIALEPYSTTLRLWCSIEQQHRYMSLNAVPVLLANQCVSWFCTFEDMHEEVLAEQKVKQSEHQLRAILDNTQALLHLALPNGDILISNQRFQNTLCRPGAKNIYRCIHPAISSLFIQHHEQVIATKEPCSIETQLPTSVEDQPIHLKIDLFPIFSDHQDILFIGGITQDVSLLKEREQILKRQHEEILKTSEELRRFTYIVSHDLKSPLVNIQGFSAELQEGCQRLEQWSQKQNLPELQQVFLKDLIEYQFFEPLNFIKRSSISMNRMLNAILKLARIGNQELKFESLSLGDVIQEVLDSYAHAIRINNIKVDVGPLPPIETDLVAITQILHNLISNAIKYLDPNKHGNISINGTLLEHNTLISIEDNGLGIPSQDRDKIFDIFTRGSNVLGDGEGMGLSYVRAITHRLGWDIRCESTVDKGTKITLVIPKNHQT